MPAKKLTSRRLVLKSITVAMLLALGPVLPAHANGPAHPSLWFHVGEELYYNIYWGVVPVGRTRVTTAWLDKDGKKWLVIRYTTKTKGFINKIYPVNDLIESIIDPETFLPQQFTKKLSEGHYRCNEVTTFDHKHLVARWESKTNGRVKEFAIEKDTRDVVTLMYFLRSQEITPGTEMKYRVMADEKLYDLLIRVRGTDAMKFPKFGEVRSVRMEPEAAFQGIFVRKGKIVAWVSQDERRLCTRIMATVPVANIRITLAEVRGPGDDFWVKKTDKAAAVSSSLGVVDP